MATRLRRAEQVERNRESVLAAARRVFLDRGYSGATLEAIADEAGFSKGVVYSQFDSKADLLLTLLERRIDERAEQNERLVARLTGRDAFAAVWRAAGRDAVAEAAWARLLIEFRVVAAQDPALNRRYAELHARTVERLTRLLTRVHEASGLRPVMAPQTMAEFILALGSGFALERAANPKALREDEVTGLMMRGLGLEESST